MRLTPKQKLFTEEYLVDFNITQAAIRAGYAKSSNHYLSKFIASNAYFKQLLAERISERKQRLQLDQDRVVLEIARLAFNDPRRAFNQQGALLPIQDWPDDVAAAISSIKTLEVKAADGTVIGETKEIKFWDKTKNLDLAARHLGMLQDKLEITTPVSELIRAARERLRNC